MQQETEIQQILRLTLESLREKEYREETLLRYQQKFKTLNELAISMNIHEPTEELFTEYLNDQYNSYTGEISVFKKRQRIRVVNLVKSYIANGEVDTSRKPGKSVKDQIKSPELRLELEKYVQLLKDDQIQPNTICTYQRIVAYLLIYCEEKSYCSVEELVSGDIRDFILYLYDHGCFKPSTITSGLAGLKRFLSLYPTIKYLMMELPSHLPRKRKILEIYSDSEMEAIHRVLEKFYGDRHQCGQPKSKKLAFMRLRGLFCCAKKLINMPKHP